MLQKNIQKIIRSGRPIGKVLADFHDFPMVTPSRSSLIGFAKNSLQITPEEEDAWYKDAWWGYCATVLIRERMNNGRHEEVVELIDPVDWRPLEDTLQDGKGAILVSPHLSPTPVCATAFESSGYTPFYISHDYQGETQAIDVATSRGRQTSLIKSLSHLRDGGCVLCAPDGRIGDKFVTVPFLGQKVRLFSGIGELARISGAPAIWYSAGWVDYERIRLRLEKFDPVPELEPEEWTRTWYELYLDKLGQQMRARPMDLGFLNGLWITGKGGLDWYQKPPLIQKLINMIRSYSSGFLQRV